MRPRQYLVTRSALGAACLLLPVLASCLPGRTDIAPGSEETPTLSARFAGQPFNQTVIVQTGAPTASSRFAQHTPRPTSTSWPTRTPWPTRSILETPADLTPDPTGETIRTPSASEGQAVTPEPFILRPVYTDQLSIAWSAANSWGIALDMASQTFSHEGVNAIAVTPLEDYGSLFLTVVPTATQVYSYAQMLGVSFWLNAGTEAIYPDQLAVTILGSSAHTYWQEGDTSTKSKAGTGDFSETRLYFFEFNQALPPDTWVQIEVWLDDLLYDPEYEYVTGFYIKSDAGFRQMFYIDDVALIAVRD